MNVGDDSLQAARFAFQGRVLASATHEFQNHFAVIKEYNGLIGDLLRSSKSDRGSAVKRCIEISGNINKRADQASGLMEMLNRFAHRGDATLSSFSVDDVVTELLELMQRSAGQNRISLKESRGRGMTGITNNPSLLQYLLWLLLTSLIESLAEKSRISVSVSHLKDGAALIGIKSRGQVTRADDTAAPDTRLLDAAISGLGGSILRESGRGDREEISLTVPSLAGTPSL